MACALPYRVTLIVVRLDSCPIEALPGVGVRFAGGIYSYIAALKRFYPGRVRDAKDFAATDKTNAFTID
jgi:hypothetical protein